MQITGMYWGSKLLKYVDFPTSEVLGPEATNEEVKGLIERHGELFLSHVFTPQEVEFCSSRKATTQHYTANWAAKEAVLKALGTGWTGGIEWRDIELRDLSSGQPTVRLAGRARELCEQKRVGEILVSAAHCRTHATAYALAIEHE